MVSATHRKMDQPPKARPVAVKTPRWSAAGRMCPPIEGTAHRKVRNQKGASRRSIPSAYAEGGRGRQATPGLQEQGRSRTARAVSVSALQHLRNN